MYYWDCELVKYLCNLDIHKVSRKIANCLAGIIDGCGTCHIFQFLAEALAVLAGKGYKIIEYSLKKEFKSFWVVWEKFK